MQVTRTHFKQIRVELVNRTAEELAAKKSEPAGKVGPSYRKAAVRIASHPRSVKTGGRD